MRRRMAICEVAMLLMSMPSVGAELFYMDHDPFTDQYVGPTGPLVISGEIIAGDYDHLLSKILEDENRFLSQNKIILASDGGDVAEALKIAKLVKSLFSEIVVGPLTGRCVSACFFIYAAASQREADGDRLIGVNRPFIVDAETPSRPQADTGTVESKALTQVRDFLQDNEVPAYLVEEMFRHASNDAYWLSERDEATLGHKSPSFNRYLAAKCAWSDSLEREVYARKKPLEDLTQMLKCRARVTQAAAHEALAQASPKAVPGCKRGAACARAH
jgi:hypothetical protein